LVLEQKFVWELAGFGILIILDPNFNPDPTSLKKKAANLIVIEFQLIQIA
jgi:hypothetical protein